jgi:hypothetical protein
MISMASRDLLDAAVEELDVVATPADIECGPRRAWVPWYRR